ncbi:hypothetical protein [Petropleomorpha daqingensis]|uniref:Uncharacterized protein n=1 Tax=Petropleomorpha daqingensis TaxID=2026353 RepID=A0A853CM28_9ACTN|nr:hypothetical protein [Petropleomorpha daqingensis]NYJ07043.1 hypothetical protein [Petropleomorpha daqingensis]
MKHLDPYFGQAPRQDPLAAAHHRRLVRAGFHPAPPFAPVHRLLPERAGGCSS